MSTWTSSSACSMGSCVKVRHVDGHVEVCDDTAPDTVLHITPADWAAFLVGAKAGEFDGPAADYDDTYAPLSYCERRGDRCHTCSKATSTVVPWHGVDQ